jgi:polyhydroxyalkanoate synthesis regulator phasin
MPDDKNSALGLISEILDKMIDMQQASTEAMTGLKSAVEDSARNLQEINDHFKNGFRSEIKHHITDELTKRDKPVTDLKEEITELKVTVQDFRELMSKPGYWVKLILTTIVATATAIGGIVALIFKLMS